MGLTLKAVDKRWMLGMALGIGLTGWFAYSIEWGPLREAFSGVIWGWVLLGALLMMIEWSLRAVRWLFLIRHTDPGITLTPLWSATMIGSALNTFLPLRGGDLIRPAVLARRRGMPYTTAFASTIVERLFDVLGLLCVLGLILLWMPASAFDDVELFAGIRRWGWAIAIGGIVLLLGTLLLGTRGARTTVIRLLAPFPGWFRVRGLNFFDQVVSGLAVAGRPSELLWGLLSTVLIWASQFFAILCLFWAFELDLPWIAAFFVEAAVVLSIALPQAPGFWGVFHVVMESALKLWDAPVGAAQGSALVFWAMCFVPVTVVGLAMAWWEGLGLLGARGRVFAELEEREAKALAGERQPAEKGPVDEDRAAR